MIIALFQLLPRNYQHPEIYIRRKHRKFVYMRPDAMVIKVKQYLHVSNHRHALMKMFLSGWLLMDCLGFGTVVNITKNRPTRCPQNLHTVKINDVFADGQNQ